MRPAAAAVTQSVTRRRPDKVERNRGNQAAVQANKQASLLTGSNFPTLRGTERKTGWKSQTAVTVSHTQKAEPAELLTALDCDPNDPTAREPLPFLPLTSQAAQQTASPKSLLHVMLLVILKESPNDQSRDSRS